MQAKQTIQDMLQLATDNCVTCQVVFVVCLNIDVQLKQLLIQGLSDYKLCGMSDGKAVLFYKYLESEIILPWLMDERVCNTKLLRQVKEYYLLS
jgi:hypothetical protein